MILKLDTYFKLKNSLIQFFLYLITFAAIATYDIFAFSRPLEQTAMAAALLITVITTFIVIYVLRDIFQHPELNPFNMFISGIIVYILLHPTNEIWVFALAVMCTGAVKLLRYRSQPIFNPTAGGLFLTFVFTSILTKVGFLSEPALISWWGADMVQNFLKPQLLMYYMVGAVFLLGFLYFSYSFKKIPYVIAIVMTVFLFLFFDNLRLHSSSEATISFIMNSFFSSFAFLVLVMLSEPKTSPVFPKQQVAVGIIVGAVFFAGSIKGIPLLGSEISFIQTILVGNIFTTLFKTTTFLR